MIPRNLHLLRHFSTQKSDKSIFLLTYNFVEDTYYKRRFPLISLDPKERGFIVPFKQTHNKLIESLEKSQKAKIVGGSMFPMEKAYIFFLCEGQSTVEDFVNSVPILPSKA